MSEDKTPPEDIDSTETFQESFATPSRIGHYRILEKLGEGGMGIVNLAQQEEPIRRRVALKVIKPGMDSEQVLARFESERQAVVCHYSIVPLSCGFSVVVIEHAAESLPSHDRAI